MTITQLEELAQLYGARQVSAVEWLAARSPIESRLSVARAELARLTGTTAVNGVGNGEALRSAGLTFR